MEQRTEEWYEARLGKITASRFIDVLTMGRKGVEWGKTAMGYAYEIVAEIMTGVKKPNIKANALEWGTEVEPLAREAYEQETFVKVKDEGFVEYNNHIGCSPDGLVGADGGLEIKCPYTSVRHLSTILSRKVPDEYIPQVQGSMLVTGRKWWDYESFDPRFKKNKTIIIRVERDQVYIDTLEERLEKFWKIIQGLVERSNA